MNSRKPKDVLEDALEALGASEGELEALVLTMSEAKRRGGPESLRTRLMQSLASTHRFEELEATVASLLDVDASTAARFLLAVDSADAWSAGPVPGVDIFHVEGGPAVADAVTGFVRLGVNASFPEHEHLGDEVVLVLQGALEDSHGRLVQTGEAAPMPAQSTHSFRVVGTRPLIYLAVIQRGVRINGVSILAGDPAA
jgi:hypothetical protein